MWILERQDGRPQRRVKWQALVNTARDHCVTHNAGNFLSSRERIRFQNGLCVVELVCTVYGVLCTVYYVLCNVYCVPCTVYCVMCTVYRVPCTVRCTVYRILCTI